MTLVSRRPVRLGCFYLTSGISATESILEMPDRFQDVGLAWAPFGVVAILTLGLGLMRPSYISWMPTAYAAPAWLPSKAHLTRSIQEG